MTDDRHSGQVPPPPPSAPAAVTAAPGPWQGQPPGPVAGSPVGGGGPRRRVPGWIVAVAVATAIGSVASFLLGLLWPSGTGHTPAGPLSFHGFLHIGQVVPEQPSALALVTVQGGQAYVGWRRNGELALWAVDVATGTVRWRDTMRGASGWSQLIASPQVLLVLAEEFDPDKPRPLYARDPDTGEARWEIEVHGRDQLFLTERVLGWLDNDGETFRGIDLVSGEVRWSHRFDGAATAVQVVSPESLAQPTDRDGRAMSGMDDPRLVLVRPDRTVLVIDGDSGAVISQQVNVASPRDLLLGYRGHLFVVQNQPGYRLESYNLADLTEPPRTIHRGADPDRLPRTLAPCGTDRVCVVDYQLLDNQSTLVTAVEITDGRPRWQQQVPAAYDLLPVGDWVAVVTAVTFPPQVVVLDDTGAQRHALPGVPARLNDGNLIIFSHDLQPTIGLAVGVEQPVELGRLPGNTIRDCAWNDRYLVCVGVDAAGIWRFAEPD